MFDNDVEDALMLLRPVVAKLEADQLEGVEAARLVELFAEGAKLCAAGRAIAARRVDTTDVWRREGFRSAAAWMASKAGMPVGHAIASMELMGQLDQLPATAEAFRAGRLSEKQAQEIASAATDSPEAEQDLLAMAGRSSFVELQEQARRVKAAAASAQDEAERYDRIRRRRYVKTWTEMDGAFRLDARLTPDDGARVLAALDARRRLVAAEARAAGHPESWEAYGADALVDLARAAGGEPDRRGPEATIHVWVDWPALVRGHTADGERCEIPGIGPVPVSVARRLANDAILKVILTDSVDITAVAHAGRTVSAHQRTAVEARDPKCIVPFCDVRRDLQIDHRAPYVELRVTDVDDLARLCRWHHYQKSHLGYRYRGGPGNWEWIPPDQPSGPPLFPP